jgi:HipA-like kinase
MRYTRNSVPYTSAMPRTYTANRYLQPLREGGSLPAVVDTDGGGLFVTKFRGAGQGARALIAEIIVGLLAHDAGLPVPELALIDVPPPFGRSEPDPEIQDLLRGSHGVNVGLRYLDGAFNFEGTAAGEFITTDFASRLVWFDAFVTNPDRTHRNPNILVWERQPWLIDHGAALYAHHDWASVDDARAGSPFARIRDHVLLSRSDAIEALDEEMTSAMSDERIAHAVAQVPDELLLDPLTGVEFDTAAEARDRYVWYLGTRREASSAFVAEAVAAREKLRSDPPARLPARR